MVTKTPAELIPGTASDTSVVHSSQNDDTNLSRKHTERGISRLQSAIHEYEEKTYNIGDLVIESDLTYRNTTAITVSEPFNAAKWEILIPTIWFYGRTYGGTQVDDTEYVAVNGGSNGANSTFTNRCMGVPVDCNLDLLTVNVETNSLTTDATFSIYVGDDVGSAPSITVSIAIPAGAGEVGLFQNLVDVISLQAGQTIAWRLDVTTGGDNINALSSGCRVTQV